MKGIKIPKHKTPLLIGGAILLLFIALTIKNILDIQSLQKEKSQLLVLTNSQNEKIASFSALINDLEKEDLRVTNNAIKATVSATQKSFVSYATLLEKISDAKFQKINVATSEAELPKIVRLLSTTSWIEANQKIDSVGGIINKQITENQTKLATSVAPSAPQSNTLPGDGLSTQTVSSSVGSFTVTLIAADLSSTRILTDTASDNDCVDNSCATLPLGDYVSRNGGFAGINGSYFCPPDYAQCAGKPGSFGTLVFNSRTKKYINSDNNKFSTVPMFVQTGDRSMRFMGQTLEWGRDTGIIGGLANQPMLVSGGKAATTDGGGGGGRNFIGTKSGKVYIGHVYGANFGQAAKVLETLGMEFALNLDTGGSTALMYNGKYLLGPGRLLPNAIILAH